jgi:phosphoenolpyruvate carboxykinase (ATP)
MASQPSYEFYKDDLRTMPPLRAVAETLLCDRRVREVTPAEAYAMAAVQPDVMTTDLPVYPPAVERLGLPGDAKVLNNCHGRIVGRTAKARRFYNRLDTASKTRVLGDVREAVFAMQAKELIRASVVVGLDPDLMIRATMICGADDAVNLYNWLVNFTPFAELAETYATSPTLPIPDIVIIADKDFPIAAGDGFYNDQGGPQLALVDEKANVIFNFGMRYFGERKKGTLTLAWTSGMQLGMAACHGGIKELDFTNCGDPACADLGKRSIAFFGLSGTGKSSHTNSADNAGTLPEGVEKVVLHDDAFQIDMEQNVCRVWEPTLFDKTDGRGLGHPDWEYIISVQNHGMIEVEGRVLPLGEDIRNPNGRALFDRGLLGAYVNRCAFPHEVVWLMKDTCLPPVIRFTDVNLAVAMGASLMTRRNRAENVSEEELAKLVFEPFANPFRVYELWRDVEAFLGVFTHGATGYSFNSVGFWRTSDTALNNIPLTTSLTLQTLILMERLEWQDWDLLPGAQIPVAESIDPFLPGYSRAYDPAGVDNRDSYLATLADRFAQRREFLKASDLRDEPELLTRLTRALNPAV